MNLILTQLKWKSPHEVLNRSMPTLILVIHAPESRDRLLKLIEETFGSPLGEYIGYDVETQWQELQVYGSARHLLSYQCAVVVYDGWDWSDKHAAWHYGEQNDGAGVYRDDDGWRGNVCHPLQHVMIGPYRDKFTAQQEAVKELKRLRELNNGASTFD